MSTKTVKCSWKFCRHESREISRDIAVNEKGKYYHEDCAKDKNNMVAIRDFYYENISNTVVITLLAKTIKTIVLNKNVDSDFFLFALKYAFATGRKISNPAVLHYIVDDEKIKDIWKSRQESKVLNGIKEITEDEKEDVISTEKFKYTADQNVGFGSFMNGDCL